MRPLVTIAIPTYQRVDQLRHSIESVLAQDYQPIELIISDNASTDRTREICEAYAVRHPSIRYIRQPRNVGPTSNFEGLRRLARGEHFMFLADDDWIDPHYVSACVAAIEADPTCTLVCGRAKYHRKDSVEDDPHPVNLEDADARGRVLGFCRSVRLNAVFYGVTPMGVDRCLPTLRNVLGGDWLRVMALAYLGRVRTVEEVAVHRAVGGTTVSLANVAATLGLGRFQATAPQIAIAYWVFRDIAFDSPVYRQLGRVARLRLACRAAWITFVRFVPGAVVKFGRLRATAIARRWRAPAPEPQAS